METLVFCVINYFVRILITCDFLDKKKKKTDTQSSVFCSDMDAVKKEVKNKVLIRFCKDYLDSTNNSRAPTFSRFFGRCSYKARLTVELQLLK